MNRSTHAALGLDSILELLEMRFEYDTLGRIVQSRSGGVTPRFVLGRSREGCVWRFSARVEPEIVRRVAKLAGREPALADDPGARRTAPERWVAIERLLGDPSRGAQASRPVTVAPEIVTLEGVDVGELWTID